MKVSVGNALCGNENRALLCHHRLGLGKRRRTLGIDKFSRYKHYENKCAQANGNRPELFFPCSPLLLALFGAGNFAGWRQTGLTGPPVKQDHESGQHKDDDEEKHAVAYNRSDHGHLPLAAGKNLRLGKLVQAGHQQLQHHARQDDAGHAEKFPQIHPKGASHKDNAKDDSQGQADNDSNQAQQIG